MAPLSFDFASTSDTQAPIMSKTDMDVDMDIELGPVDDLGIIEEDAAMKIVRRIFERNWRSHYPLTLNTYLGLTFNIWCSKEVTVPEVYLETHQNGSPSPSISDSNHLTPYKVHLRGLDNLRTNDIKAFASEHFSEGDLLRIEWIDDTSANLVYGNAAIAVRALESFSAIDGDQMDLSDIPVLQLRPIKNPSADPEVRLEARLAVVTDRKQPGARERSRFYLFNPEEDPGERRDRRRRVGGRGHYTNEGDYGDYRRRRYDDEEQRRRNGGDVEFNANLYDDNVGDASRDSSSGRSGNRGRNGRAVRFREEGNNGRELFPERAQESRRRRDDRDRSASPGRERASDGHMEIDNEENLSAKRRRRFRQRSPSPGRGGAMETQNRPSNQGKELFPEKKSISSNKDISSELRSTSILQTSTTSRVKELFPQKIQNQSHHKRSPAFDATTHTTITTNRTVMASAADDPADLFAGKMMVPFTDGTSDLSTTRKSKTSTGFNILGAATRIVDQQDQGFSIRGAAAATSATAGLGVLAGVGRELFPEKVSSGSGIGLNDNARKELFADKLESGRLGRLGGARGRRRKAEDMFY